MSKALQRHVVMRSRALTPRTVPVLGAAQFPRPPSQAARFSTVPVDDEPRKPTIQEAKGIYREYYELPNDLVMTLGVKGDFDAINEALIREIIRVDGLAYDDAVVKSDEVLAATRTGKTLANLPYNIGVFTAYTAAFASIPLCFHLDTCLAFNQYFVTTEVPPAKDLETALEVGSWSWAWMEPPLGQISFVLLCLQLSRAQMINVGIKPYTDRMRAYRANMLLNQYPKYNPNVVKTFSLLAQTENR